MALLGENGAGKSTLIKALTGIPRRSRHHLAGRPGYLTEKSRPCTTTGIGTVYQEVNLLPNMSVADNLFIGREPKRFGLLRRKEMEKRATELMAFTVSPSTCANRLTVFRWRCSKSSPFAGLSISPPKC
ncbi:ATP-binding cassette domain-containing protein [Escherichia coli]